MKSFASSDTFGMFVVINTPDEDDEEDELFVVDCNGVDFACSVGNST